MVSSIIRNFIAKRMFQQKGAIANNKSVEFSANALEQRLKNLGVDPNTIKSEGELNQILSFVKQAEDQAFNQKFGNVLSGNKFQKKAEVVDLKNKKLDTEKPILGGTQGNVDPNSEIAKSLRMESDAKKRLKKLNMSNEEINLRGDSPYDTDEQILQRLKIKNKEAIERLKNKKDPPEELAGGGVAGLLGERTGFQGGGSDASTTSFSKSYDSYNPGSNTASKANKTVDAQQAAGQSDADNTNRRVEANRQRTSDINRMMNSYPKRNPIQKVYDTYNRQSIPVKILANILSGGAPEIYQKAFQAGNVISGGIDRLNNPYYNEDQDIKGIAGGLGLVTDQQKGVIDAQGKMGQLTGAFNPDDTFNAAKGVFDLETGKYSLDDKGEKNIFSADRPAEPMTRQEYDAYVKDKGYAEGGIARSRFAMGKRAFLKAMGAGVAGIAGLKTGLFGLGKKAAVKEVAKEVATGGPPPHFLKLVAKIKSLGDNTTPKYGAQPREKVTSYKDYTLSEELDSGRTTIQRSKQSEVDYYDEMLMEDVYMSHTPGKGLADETTKGKNIPDEYVEDTSYMRTSGPQKGDILDTVDGIPDDILEELGEAVVKKADGGRIGYSKGKIVTEGIPGLLKLVKNKFGKESITTADKIKIPQKTLDRNMFKNFETKFPETSAADTTLNIPVQQEGKFTKAEYLIQRLENTIKESPNDKYVKKTFPGFIKELKANPELAKNENVFKELGGDLPEGQQIVVYGDDTLDFFTQKSGPGNIDRLKKLTAQYPSLSREKALKIMKMEPNDQVMELKMLEIANRTKQATGGLAAMLGE